MNEDSQFNNTREQNGVKNHPNRKQSSTYKYSDNKGNRYSPSASYNYNGQSRGNTAYQQSRRKERYKKESGGSGVNDKLIKQNDTIIRLLKEIRDRIVNLTNNSQDGQNENIEHTLKAVSKETSKENRPVSSAEPTETKIEKSENIISLTLSPETTDSKDSSNSAESMDDISSTESQPEENAPADQLEENSSKKPLKIASSKS